jgi:hypothetical protein
MDRVEEEEAPDILFVKVWTNFISSHFCFAKNNIKKHK